MSQNYIKILLNGDSPERFINLCRNKNIYIWGLDKTDNGHECYLYAKDFRKIKQIVKKSRIKVRILERHGIYFVYHQYRKRKVFLFSFCIGLLLLFYMTRFVWSIDIQGNYTITDDVMYDYLKTIGIEYGMLQKEISCEEICTSLRRDFLDVIWVSAALEGTTLSITVRENTDRMERDEMMEKQGDVLANEAGEIVSIITRQGIPMVKKGDCVQRGDVLVSGTIPVVNDAGEQIREEFVKADADIILKRRIEFQAICRDAHFVKVYMKTIKPKLILYIGSYRIEIGLHKPVKNQEVTAVQKDVYEPIGFRIEKQREYVWKEQSYEESEQINVLEEAYKNFQKDLKESGADIIEEEVLIQDTQNGKLYTVYVEVLQQVVDLS